ncbi:hypothetical protein NQ314_001605 [Rhamnusium bicolor]|uniref:EXS domain-containing protein n=1 Tax=Rhamnusium bicolor TaxID=1586634 RepID=A0AAV8ZS99_9CUCU|nr:hypothetical protein NQ314_001605 [Rhamnusium bicolor]
MKFAEHLSAHITPEWRKQYINYEQYLDENGMLIRQLMAGLRFVNRPYVIKGPQLLAFLQELRTVNNTEKWKYHDINSFTYKEFKYMCPISKDQFRELYDYCEPVPKEGGHDYVSKKDLLVFLCKLKQGLSDNFLKVIFDYSSRQSTSYVIAKLLNTDLGAKWRQEHVEASHFFTNKDIDKIINDTENMVTNELEGGDRQKAMKRLRVPPLGEQQSPWTTFKVGLFSGSFIVLLIAVVLSEFTAIFHEGTSENLKIAFRLYRGPLLIVEFLFLIGVNVYGWRSSGVNHVLIFELDPRNHLSEQHLMELAAIFGVVWALSLLSFLYSASLSIPPYVNPLGLVVIMLAFILNPFKVFRHDARFWFLKLCFLICFYFTNGNWLEAGDTAQCMEKNFVIRPIVSCIPAWLRFAQCLRRYYDTKEAFPHLANAGKYATTFVVVIFATLKSVYQGKRNNSSYSYTWDIKMDWGLLDKSAGENTFLREEIVYSSTFFYYFAIVEDLILRFSWAISLYLTEMGYVSIDLMTSILSPLEVFRRFVWNFFRLENEHLNNCGKFRAVRDISVAPIDSSDQIQIMRMMDEEDGVVNRGKRKANKKKEEKKPLLHDESIINFKAVPMSTIQA